MANDVREHRYTSSYEDWDRDSSPNTTMSAASPTELKREGGSGYGSTSSDHGQSPLSQTLGFLKNLTEKKNVRGKISSVDNGRHCINRHDS